MKADSWSVGCVAYQMITGSPPWKNLGYTNPVSLFNYIQSVEGPPHIKMPDDQTMAQSSEDIRKFAMFRNLVNKCFLRNPNDRPCAKEMLNDSFFSEEHLWKDLDQSDCSSLFSPGSTCSRKPMTSPMGGVNMSPIYVPARRRNSFGSTRSPFMSPPIPRHTRSSRRVASSVSPMPDVSGWPTWAKDKYVLKSVDVAASLATSSLEFSDDSEMSRRQPVLFSKSTQRNFCFQTDAESFHDGPCSSGSGSTLRGLDFL